MLLDAEEKIEELKVTIAYQEDVSNTLRSHLDSTIDENKNGDVTPPLFQLCYEILTEMEYVGHLNFIANHSEKHKILMTVEILSLQFPLNKRLVL